MITYAAFSRFCRWYRWPIRISFLAWLAGVAITGHWAPGVVFAFAALILCGEPSEHVRLVVDRHERIRGRRGAAEAARLRSQPLRGWTKGEFS